ncbi:MAG TPA: ABC transporter permease, partial [Rhizobiaceae bacterium]|nr:ABC transporter permease [Rhizobiaceae bacterium]
MSDRKPGFAVSGFALLVILFLQVPVIVVVLAAFSKTSYLTIPPQGLTLEWFGEVLTDPTYLSAIRISLLLAVGATIASLILGIAAAYAIHKRMLPGSDALTSFLMAPLVVPSVVIGVALLQYFTLIGWRGSFLALIVAHTVITVPYIVRSALASLSGLDTSIEEAARVLGADGPTAFRLVTLPLIKPGLVAGALFAFVTSMENVPVTIFLASA